jgi:lysophospholipase L1-like esterase
MPNAVLIGHSYIRRLEQLLIEEPGAKNGPDELVWKFVGVSGASLEPDLASFKNIFHQLPEVVALQPLVVFIHIGENDLREQSPAQLLENLFLLVSRIAIAAKPLRIVVGHLFPFPANDDLRNVVDYINEQIDLTCKTGFPELSPTRVLSWFHTVGARNRKQAFVYQDGVHLRRETLVKYAHSVGTALGRQFNAIRREHRD